MGYLKPLMLLLCIAVVFLLEPKTFYMEKYLERMNIKATMLQSPYPIEVNVSLEKRITENALLPLGGHSKPENCTALQKIAIVIPFRNREPHLHIWLYNMHPFLQKQQADYAIYVVEQHGESKFNRAKLMNVGYSEAIQEYDYNCFIFSDVDIPMDQRNLYRCSENPKHMAHALDKFKFRDSAEFLIVICSQRHFCLEDDELYQRVIAANMTIERPHPKISRSKAILHKRDAGNEQNKKSIPLIKKAGTRMHIDGLSTLNYTIIGITKHRLYTKVMVDIGQPEKSFDFWT
ncbi:PREDICTED: beta-1,4-galactosyltransferase 1-like [Nanorana parkeri]|uniref:beta-1,4-galactosyltransferase 1-like n=1 Tax=Nanorana parkeri TaxID=125878 RepID=UPI0008547B35|nr:PREDICTED: beta-1,4-galactosyltransferase 1-like [Nanorana parkeri]